MGKEAFSAMVRSGLNVYCFFMKSLRLMGMAQCGVQWECRKTERGALHEGRRMGLRSRLSPGGPVASDGRFYGQFRKGRQFCIARDISLFKMLLDRICGVSFLATHRLQVHVRQSGHRRRFCLSNNS